MMEMKLLEKRKRGRPKKRFLDVVKEDMEEVGVKEMDVDEMLGEMLRSNLKAIFFVVFAKLMRHPDSQFLENPIE